MMRILNRLLTIAILLNLHHAVEGQVVSRARALITEGVNESRLTTLRSNTRPEANASNDVGSAADTLSFDHLYLLLKRPPEQQEALEDYVQQLSNPNSPHFHHWLTADGIGQQFGLSQQDLDTLTNWLQGQGFTVNSIYPNRTVIDFSGNAGQIRKAFHTSIHHLLVGGERHIANMSDPQIPAALSAAVVGVVSLNDFMPRPMMHLAPEVTSPGGRFGTRYQLGPADLATIYNLNPLFSAGISGQGQTIVVVETSDVYDTNDWNRFRKVFGLTHSYPYGTFVQVHPAPPTGINNCVDPGVTSAAGEASLDVEWSSAAAPNAQIVLASCRSTTVFGGFVALQNLLNSSTAPPAIVSISYGSSESALGAATNSYINALYLQAVAEGVSVFVSSGDSGGNTTDRGSYSTHGINVSGFASTPYNAAVGGTDFGDVYAGTAGAYWNAANDQTYGSAKSYVPEIPWNGSCASQLIATYNGYATTYGADGFCNSPVGSTTYLDTASGSGGPSGCATGATTIAGVVTGTCAGYRKPYWQAGALGNPSDGVRDLPDVSLFASNGYWSHSYVFCYSDPTSGRGGVPCFGSPSAWSAAGGTSFSSPILAGFQALVNQRTGSRQGNPNPVYYALAAAEYGATGNTSCDSTRGNGTGSGCIFYDVTQGDNAVVCRPLTSGTTTIGTFSCYIPSGVNGVLSTSSTSYQPAFGATTGWDFATGLGTVNAYNLVMNWPR